MSLCNSCTLTWMKSDVGFLSCLWSVFSLVNYAFYVAVSIHGACVCFSTVAIFLIFELVRLSPPQMLPLGIPLKIAIIEKIESARGTMGRGKRRKTLFSLPPSHRSPRVLFFFLPSLPITQRGLSGRERALLTFISTYPENLHAWLVCPDLTNILSS